MTDHPDIAHLMQQIQGQSTSQADTGTSNGLLPNGKKTKGRVKIKMEYIGNKLRRYTTFSKRKTGIMKKAYELSTLTGTQVMLLVASETGHVYTYATKKLQPMIASEAGKTLIQTCLNSPEEGADLQPAKTEFTFETGGTPANSRKRKINDSTDAATNALASFLPTMVPSSLFSNFNEDDYNQADSGDDSDSEDPSEGKEEIREHDDKKESGTTTPASLASSTPTPSNIDTIKEALRAAASNRQQLKKTKTAPKHVQQPSNAFLAPFLLSGLTSSQTNQGTVFQLPQGCVYTNTPSPPEGGATANGLFLGGAKTADDATQGNPLFSLPFQFNLQQLMESAALSAQMTNTSD